MVVGAQLVAQTTWVVIWLADLVIWLADLGIWLADLVIWLAGLVIWLADLVIWPPHLAIWLADLVSWPAHLAKVKLRAYIHKVAELFIDMDDGASLNKRASVFLE